MSYYGFSPYVTVGEKKAKADKQLEKMRKKGLNPEPIRVEGRTIAKSWWGRAWVENMESYADFENRIARGRSYVRNHAVLDLKITTGTVNALVQGSAGKPYEVEIRIDELKEAQWRKISELCNNQISNLEELAEGKFPKVLEKTFKDRAYGLFPSPKEIHFTCSCPDWASMCKHIAAVLYGIGARLDRDPLLFFTLRSADCQELIKRSVESKLERMLENAGNKSERAISEDEIYDLFGI